MKIRLAHRLPLSIFAAMLPLIVILFYNLYSLQAAKEKEERADVFRAGQLVTLEFQRIVSGMQNVLATISSAPAVQALDTQRCGDFLASASERIDGVATIDVIDLTGTIRCRQEPQGIGLSIADRPFFKNALATGGFVIGEYTERRVNKKTLLPMAMPLKDASGKVIGVVALSVDLNWLQQVLVQRSLPDNASVTVADRDGIILARYPFPERFVGTHIPDAYRYLVNAEKPGTIQLMSQDGTERILAYFPVSASPEGLYISTGISVADTFLAIRRATEMGLATTLFAILLGLFLSWRSTRYAIQRPVDRILAALAAWRSNNADIRTGMSADTDEFGAIGAAIDRFMDDLAEANAQKEILIGELDHRVKNLLATVQSVASQTFRTATNPREAVTTFDNRLRAIAQSFQLLGHGDWQAAEFRSLVGQAVAPFDNPERPQFKIEGPNFLVHAQAALSISLALHELCTNAVKYGALSHPDGSVAVTWELGSTESPTLDFRWEERGGPEVNPPERSGFGSTLIDKMLTQQLHAHVHLDYPPTGLRCTITVPVSHLEHE